MAQRYEYLRAIVGGRRLPGLREGARARRSRRRSRKVPERIPEEIFPRVVAFWAHAGFYVSWRQPPRRDPAGSGARMPNDEFFDGWALAVACFTGLSGHESDSLLRRVKHDTQLLTMDSRGRPIDRGHIRRYT